MNSKFRPSYIFKRLWLLFIPLLLSIDTIYVSAQSTIGNTSSQDDSLHRTWQIGAYGQGGFALDYHVGCLCIFRYRKEQEFYTLTAEAGRMLTAAHGPGILKGRIEALAEVTPFWITHSPAQEMLSIRTILFLTGSRRASRPTVFMGFLLHLYWFVGTS
jgi:hypothetical protein